METEVVKWSLDPNIVLAVISVIAVVSPVLTTIINNIYQTRLKKLDMYESAKRVALENFIKDATAYAIDYETNKKADEKYQNPVLFQKYKHSLNSLYLYFEIPDDEEFKKILQDIDWCLYPHPKINKLTIRLTEQIKKK